MVDLRFKVHGARDSKSYLAVGQRIKNDLDNILLENTKKECIENFENVFEFGCGCGRVSMWINPERKLKFYGSDINGRAISWCKKNLGFGNFSTNNKIPPLKFSNDFFDLIYCISVFTHLDENEQFKWLDEMYRILKPNGYLLISFSGFENMPDQKELEISKNDGILKKGFVFLKNKSFFKRILLGDNAMGLAYHTKNYVLEHYSKIFKIIKYVNRGINNHQNLLVLQKELGRSFNQRN